MGAALHKQSIPQYLTWEAEQPGRNEFWRGEVFAMVGAKRGHGRVVAKLMRHLGNHLDDSPCQAFSESMSDDNSLMLQSSDCEVSLASAFKNMGAEG
jgi:Putative restriction endonuclease